MEFLLRDLSLPPIWWEGNPKVLRGVSVPSDLPVTTHRQELALVAVPLDVPTLALEGVQFFVAGPANLELDTTKKVPELVRDDPQVLDVRSTVLMVSGELPLLVADLTLRCHRPSPSTPRPRANASVAARSVRRSGTGCVRRC